MRIGLDKNGVLDLIAINLATVNWCITLMSARVVALMDEGGIKCVAFCPTSGTNATGGELASERVIGVSPEQSPLICCSRHLGPRREIGGGEGGQARNSEPQIFTRLNTRKADVKNPVHPN